MCLLTSNIDIIFLASIHDDIKKMGNQTCNTMKEVKIIVYSQITVLMWYKFI